MIRFTFFVVLLSVASFAQTQPNLSGRIQDAQGASIEGAEVRLYRQETGAFRNAVSTASGEYRFERMDAGNTCTGSAQRWLSHGYVVGESWGMKIPPTMSHCRSKV